VLIAGVCALLVPLIYFAIPVAMFAGSAAVVLFIISAGIKSPAFVVFLIAMAMGLLLAGLGLLSPLFQRRRQRETQPIVVTRASEPLLFHLIDAIARALSAPPPDAVHFDCEANAGVLDGDRTTLLLGLPLVAALDVRELAGVIAHELGHLRQGWARRFIMQIARVFHWFETVVERGSRALEDRGETDLAETFRLLGLVIGVRVLAAVLSIANHIVLVLARQMEFDADRYLAMVAGGSKVRAIGDKIVAADLLLAITLMQRGPVPDNLPRWIEFHLAHGDAKVRNIARRVSDHDATGVPHPPWKARVNAVRQMNAKGLPIVEAPATSLFRSFDAYAKRATLDATYDILRGARLVPVDECVRTWATAKSDRRA
jgi:Zn-dependent protease with chaperone function